ncbi:hypothetical protein ABZ714_20425 [Streptomyces sp. NPDC006798]|uniref:hypothetical protein n=1 Tax=Streptomyces sp. NPDC006798 TaxID=3155462 RepID=UPI0033C9DD8C
MKRLTGSVSGDAAESAARQIRHQLLGEEPRRYEEECVTFTEEELAAAQGEIFGAAGRE